MYRNKKSLRKNINKCGWVDIRKRLMDVGESSEHNDVSTEETITMPMNKIIDSDWSGMGGRLSCDDEITEAEFVE